MISNVTKKVVKDLGKLSNQEFMNKYSGTKSLFLKRLAKYGDPYMKAPLAKLGKFLGKIGR